MEDKCILGLDYLASMTYPLDLASMKLLAQGRTVPFRVVMQSSPSSEGITLRVTMIPPRSEKLIKCTVSGPFYVLLGLVEPDTQYAT